MWEKWQMDKQRSTKHTHKTKEFLKSLHTCLISYENIHNRTKISCFLDKECLWWISFPWTRRMMHVEGEMLTIPEDVSSPPVFSGGFVDQYFVFCAMFSRSLWQVCKLLRNSLVLCVCFVDRCLSICHFSVASIS
jgi:hypothetical protein